MTSNPSPRVAPSSAVRLRYFDREGVLRIAVIISNVPFSEIKERAAEVRSALEAQIEAQGGAILDISVDLEDAEPIVPHVAKAPARGEGFLRLATVNGRAVQVEPIMPPAYGILVRPNDSNCWATLLVHALNVAVANG